MNRSGKVIDYKIAVPSVNFSPSNFIASEFQEYNIDDFYESILRLHLKTRTYVCHGITARALLPANSYTTHLLSSTCATNEGIAVLEVWSIFSFAIKRILRIKRIFPCSFANKRMRLLTRVYGMCSNTCYVCSTQQLTSRVRFYLSCMLLKHVMFYFEIIELLLLVPKVATAGKSV